MQLLEMLETVMLSPEGDKWKEEQHQKPENYEKWLDAQWLSLKACENVANFKDLIFPLERTETPLTLKNMWKTVNLVGGRCCGIDIFLLFTRSRTELPSSYRVTR